MPASHPMAEIAPVRALNAEAWSGPWPEDACDSLEHGSVLHFRHLRFALMPDELALVAGGITVCQSKNISQDPDSGRLSGVAPGIALEAPLRRMMARFAGLARSLVLGIAPSYEPALKIGRTSFRPAEIAGRCPADWRSDDTRLHTDAFPATPTGGDRILRVFANVDPNGRQRIWRIGEDFAKVAAAYLPQIRPPLPCSASLLRAIGRTRTRRSPYDHYMLRLHNMAKADRAYQAGSPQQEIAFGPSVWMVFSDQVPHAAMAGRNALECTFYLPPDTQRHPELSPLKVLERMTGRQLTIGVREAAAKQ
jgi:3-deoxy-D-manno-oct-2-ulosonic acid (Kdo) hydroxylase